MKNNELEELMREFIAEQCDNDKDDWYTTSQAAAHHVLGNFVDFLQSKGKKIRFPKK